MAKAESVRRNVGRSSAESVNIGVRLAPEQLAALDAWIDAHPGARLSRPEAVRRALAGFLSLHGAVPSRPI